MTKKVSKKVIAESVDTGLSILDTVIGGVFGISPVSTIRSTATLCSKLKEERFISHLETFFKQTSKVSDEQKDRFLVMLDNDRDEFFDRLLLLIERSEHKYKTEVLGKLFSALMIENITRNSFLLLANIIDRIFVEDLITYKKLGLPLHNGVSRDQLINNLSDEIGDGFIDRLVSAGLIHQSSQTKYSYTIIGGMLYHYG